MHTELPQPLYIYCVHGIRSFTCTDNKVELKIDFISSTRCLFYAFSLAGELKRYVVNICQELSYISILAGQFNRSVYGHILNRLNRHFPKDGSGWIIGVG